MESISPPTWVWSDFLDCTWSTEPRDDDAGPVVGLALRASAVRILRHTKRLNISSQLTFSWAPQLREWVNHLGCSAHTEHFSRIQPQLTSDCGNFMRDPKWESFSEAQSAYRTMRDNNYSVLFQDRHFKTTMPVSFLTNKIIERNSKSLCYCFFPLCLEYISMKMYGQSTFF